VPFGDDLEEPYLIYETILTGEMTYPSFVKKDFAAKPFIERLLSRQPAFRKGNDIGGLKNHHWFINFNWHDLLLKL
jgi:cGMP-dependent protein kinase